MDQGDNEDSQDIANDPILDSVEISVEVRAIFDGIFDEPMKQFKEPLTFIKENKFGVVWSDDTEKQDKVMRHAKTFQQALTASFSYKHAEAAKLIEGSTCDLFLQYVKQKLDESLLSQDPFKDSCKKVNKLITSKILRLKHTLEAQQDDQPERKSDLEVMISETELLDPIHIQHALMCCQVAYDCKDQEQGKNSLENLEKENLLSELSVSYENENVPKYVMARCGDVLYVCFKGVQSHNFGSTEMSHRGEICSGVSKAAEKIPLKYFAREILENKRIVFSGHSSGGAVASLVLLLLLEKFKHQKEEFLRTHFQCITFGLMPLGDHIFKQYVESIPGAQDCFCHIVQKNDIVPKLFGAFNMTHIQTKLWELVDQILNFTEKIEDHAAFSKLSTLLQFILGSKVSDSLLHFGFRIDHFDIFGVYYILDTTRSGQKYSVVPASRAADRLRIDDFESLRHMRSQYLINHKMERYAHEVELALPQNLADLKKFKRTCSVVISDDITPKITEVRFESIGEDVVAKIGGSNMWFVYNVTIEGVNGDGKDLKVDVMKSSESEVQTRMRTANIVHAQQVAVRVKTHFQNSKYLQSTPVPAKTTTYMVSRKQQQLAKHSPRGIIELAYLSALLERRQEGYHKSTRFKAIKTFFESAVSVVPLESLFHAMANANANVALQCCKIFSSGSLPRSALLSESLISSMDRTLSRLGEFIGLADRRFTKVVYAQHVIADEYPFAVKPSTQLDFKLLSSTHSRIQKLVKKYKNQVGKQRYQHSPCNVNLEVIYPSADDDLSKSTIKASCCKAPMTLLTQGRKELDQLSEEFVTEHFGLTDERRASNTNSKMLSVLTNLRREFETCSTLLGAFMESQVQIPLEKSGGDRYVDQFAKHASSFGLSVWGLLILPFKILNKLISSNVSEDFRQFVVEFSRHIRGFRNFMFPSSEHQFPNYDQRLEFLVGSMKQSWVANQQYVSYSLERQLEDQCTKRNLFHHTPLGDILDQWNDNFEDETLTLVPNEYRPLVARWIKWSLMINSLRENLASQTAVGVIGLVNSGKSKFVRSMFGKETITGTTDQKRTTVPLIYNLSPNIIGMDVIDFPGVDDRDKSIPELAKLLLSLTRVVIFVVDYRRAHTESTKDWLSILDKENVPVLICLNFADKLYAELMGENGDRDAEIVKAGIEKQLATIKELIGQPESGHQRDFKLTVFGFDNDSKLNTDEGKEKLRKAGLSDELDVGRWIAAKLQDYEEKVSQNVIKFIEGKEKSTLNSNRRTSVPVTVAEEKNGSPENCTTLHKETILEDGAPKADIFEAEEKCFRSTVQPKRELDKNDKKTHETEHTPSAVDNNHQCLGNFHPRARITTGTINKFIKDRRFGFIHADGIKERVFFHCRHLMPNVVPSIGTRVHFQLEENEQGYIAKNIDIEGIGDRTAHHA